MRRVRFLPLLLFFPGVLCCAGPASLLVVFSSAVEPYVQAARGIREEMAGQPVALSELDLSRDRERLAEVLARVQPSAIVAVGSEAVAAVAAQQARPPVIASMILRAGSTPARAVSTVFLDVPVAEVAGAMQRGFHGASRLGVIRGPWSAHMKIDGTRIQVADCPRAEDLLNVFLSLKGKVEFVACLPDGTLYNSTTVKRLVLSSLQNRLPLIGYSEAFARSGAALAVYPDYRDVGAMAAEAARKLLAGQDVPEVLTPRRFRSAVNQRVVRLMGLSHDIDLSSAELVIR